MDATKIIDTLAGRRRLLKISQEDLGSQIGVSRNYVNRVENHHINPTLGMVTRMCDVLGVDLEINAVYTKPCTQEKHGG